MKTKSFLKHSLTALATTAALASAVTVSVAQAAEGFLGCGSAVCLVVFFRDKPLRRSSLPKWIKVAD